MDAPAPQQAGKSGRIRQKNRAAILAAAEQVFADKGYEGATTAEIAQRAGLPKSNVHYYFGTKDAIYRAIIDDIMHLWLEAFGDISEQDDPAEALAAYIRAKVIYSKERPLASRIFANEVNRGAPLLSEFLSHDLADWVQAKSAVLRKWAKTGRMDPIAPEHLFFMIWSATQTYADFEVQMRGVLGHRRLTEKDYETAIETITHVILKGCGITRAGRR